MRYTSLLILALICFAVCESAKTNHKSERNNKPSFELSEGDDIFGGSYALSDNSTDLDHNFEPLEVDEKWFTAPLAYFNKERAADIAGQYQIFIRIFTSDIDKSAKFQRDLAKNLDIRNLHATGAERFTLAKSALPEALRRFRERFAIQAESELAVVQAEIEACEKGFTLDFAREQYAESGRDQHRQLVIATKCSDPDRLEVYWNEVKYDSNREDRVKNWVLKSGEEQVTRTVAKIVFDAAFADLIQQKVQSRSLA